MFGKGQTKILLRYYEQTLLNFSITLYLSQAFILFHTTCLHPASGSLWSNLQKYLLSSGSSCAGTLLSLSTLLSCLLLAKGKFMCFDENFIITSSPSHPSRENFVFLPAFCLFFFFLFFFFFFFFLVY